MDIFHFAVYSVSLISLLELLLKCQTLLSWVCVFFVVDLSARTAVEVSDPAKLGLCILCC